MLFQFGFGSVLLLFHQGIIYTVCLLLAKAIKKQLKSIVGLSFYEHVVSTLHLGFLVLWLV
jgi:hypothetical protein